LLRFTSTRSAAAQSFDKPAIQADFGTRFGAGPVTVVVAALFNILWNALEVIGRIFFLVSLRGARSFVFGFIDKV
jgi:hypothetical protein